MSNSSFYSNTGITSADVSSITSAKEAAATSETNAATSATNAATSSTNAATSATNAATSETNASNSAATATTSAANASTSETNASASAATATTQASNAATSATAAAGSASTAGTSATNAASSATNAATSETNAATSETNAANSATSAATSATNAGTSETNAAASASSASGYVTSATTQANNAATSATAAATSETNAASSATAASTSASGASTSASNANTSATNAASSASQAATSAAAAALAADNFDDTYLGSNASDPTTDNDGDALNAGDLHFNTSSNTLKVYNGSAWQDAAIDSSGFVQTTGDTMTGNLDVQGTVTSDGLTVDGKTTTDELDLSAIAATISDTAVDIFVYDTRKDSDGGAWRKRTQHTSWYNETLNTATRGSRKEFPAVAVIVSEIDQITIYDGDDPDLPMWMVFNQGGTWSSSANLIIPTTPDPVGISVLNGVLSIAYTNGYGVCVLNFISEEQATIFANNTTNYHGNISQRNDGLGHSTDASDTRLIVNSACNDVAMTVLPNAPIDAATGLPVPTIAVATDGGVSVIKDDGTVVDAPDASNLRSHFTYFTSDDEVLSGLYYEASPYNYSQAARYYIPSSDKAGWNNDATVKYDYNGSGNLYPYPNANSGWQLKALATSENRDYLGSTELLTLVDLDESDPQNNSLVAYITSSYNTGWMHGDIKLATLSDTDDTNVTGSELVTNGDFSSGTTGWSERETGGTFTVSGGQATLAYSTGAASWQNTVSGLTAGKTYTLSFDLVSASSSGVQFYYNLGSGSDLGVSMTAAAGTYTATFTAINSTVNVFPRVYSSGNMVIDNVSVRLAEEDRSVNGNGLQVFGTVTKSAVATGADLVAYSGFGNGNYLKQPYNSDLDFGTGTFSITTWAKIPTVNSYSPTLVDRHVLNQARILLYAEFGNQLPRIYIAHTNGSTSTYVTGPTAIDDGQWHCWHANRRGNGQLELWIDGVKVAYGGVGVDSISVSTNGPTIIGNDYTGGGTGYMNGDMALTRISATAPSPEQIKKIYEDEKVLFQDNAQATLYGSSDAVTALAYDDSTELLHVGTSAGRSVFQGLKRVDNTTTAVGAAISASNGLVADE